MANQCTYEDADRQRVVRESRASRPWTLDISCLIGGCPPLSESRLGAGREGGRDGSDQEGTLEDMQRWLLDIEREARMRNLESLSSALVVQGLRGRSRRIPFGHRHFGDRDGGNRCHSIAGGDLGAAARILKTDVRRGAGVAHGSPRPGHRATTRRIAQVGLQRQTQNKE